jgi:hypothetical protein
MSFGEEPPPPHKPTATPQPTLNNPLIPIPVPTQSPQIESNKGNNKPLQPSTDDFTGFWELDKLDAIGLRIDASGWIPGFPLFGGDLNLDVVYSLPRNDVTVYFTPSVLAGLGQGAAVTIGVVGYYDTPNPMDAHGPGYGAQANITPSGGLNISYGYSDQPGSTGVHSQNWSIAASGGAQLSGSGSLGWTFLLKNFGIGH